MKSEPEAYSIDDLKRDGVEPWDGIRNYSARIHLRDGMEIGDKAFFYHSNAKPIAVVGTMEIVSEYKPDPTQFDPDAKYFDPKSSESDPRWGLRDVKFIQKFENSVTRDMLKAESSLSEMILFKMGRLSITPVTEAEWKKIHELAGAELK